MDFAQEVKLLRSDVVWVHTESFVDIRLGFLLGFTIQEESVNPCRE